MFNNILTEEKLIFDRDDNRRTCPSQKLNLGADYPATLDQRHRRLDSKPSGHWLHHGS